MYHIIKRIIDVVCASLLLLVLAPFFAILSLWINLESAGPVFFTQLRFGKHKKPFKIYKFRTMVTSAPKDLPTNSFQTVEQYITNSGRILRRTGLDELPQIVNIIKGQMSFIGPRPVVLAETDLIELRDEYGANACIPGISGWAQVNGRDEVETKEKAFMDGIYYKNFGLRMDLRCLFKTLEVLITGYGHRECYNGDIPIKITQLHDTKIKKMYRRISKHTFSNRSKVVLEPDIPKEISQ